MATILSWTFAKRAGFKLRPVCCSCSPTWQWWPWSWSSGSLQFYQLCLQHFVLPFQQHSLPVSSCCWPFCYQICWAAWQRSVLCVLSLWRFLSCAPPLILPPKALQASSHHFSSSRSQLAARSNSKPSKQMFTAIHYSKLAHEWFNFCTHVRNTERRQPMFLVSRHIVVASLGLLW